MYTKKSKSLAPIVKRSINQNLKKITASPGKDGVSKITQRRRELGDRIRYEEPERPRTPTPPPVELVFEHIHVRTMRKLAGLPKENLHHIDENKIPAFLRIDYDVKC